MDTAKKEETPAERTQGFFWTGTGILGMSRRPYALPDNDMRAVDAADAAAA